MNKDFQNGSIVTLSRSPISAIFSDFEGLDTNQNHSITLTVSGMTVIVRAFLDHYIVSGEKLAHKSSHIFVSKALFA